MVSYTITSGDGAANRSDDERVHFCDKCKEEFRVFFNSPTVELQMGRMVNGVVIPIERLPGEWIDINGDGSLWKCSNCGETSCCRGKYCSDCGARMEVDDETD